ncbi:MAG: LptF/LptG family permease [Thermodesulfovibrionales bacterium]|nr:LptF/LptG family permease [Thermodesulfovibrionales bacterium]
MLAVQKMYIKEFLRVLVILTFTVTVAFSGIDFIGDIDGFLPYDPSAILLFKYVLTGVPENIHHILPVAVLLSIMFVFSRAENRKEVVAIKVAGGRMKVILIPFVGIGVIIMSFAFVNSAFVVPASSKAAYDIESEITQRETMAVFDEETLFLKGRHDSVVRISLYIPDENIAKGISIFKFDTDGLSERVDAEIAKWRDGDDRWSLRNVTLYDFADGKVMTIQETVYMDIGVSKIFRGGIHTVAQMTLPEMIKHQRRLSEAGLKSTRLTVDISSRLSHPMVNLFMLLLGMSLLLGRDIIWQKLLRAISPSHKINGRVLHFSVTAAGFGLLISIIYWIGYAFFLSLGYAGTIPPIIAPWIVPVVFATLSVYLYSQIPE